jgi:integrase/recombinase XerD
VKNERNGQAEVLTDEQLAALLNVLLPQQRLLFAICYYTSCRVSEALQLQRSDFIGDRIVFRASTTKTKQTRDVKIAGKLAAILADAALPTSGYLFPGKQKGHMTRQAADLALRKACDYIGLQGVSTHSFRRTGITKLYHADVGLKTLQKRTGHVSLANLALYIDVPQATVDAAGELL